MNIPNEGSYLIQEGVFRYNITCQSDGKWTQKKTCRMYSMGAHTEAPMKLFLYRGFHKICYKPIYTREISP